MSFSENLVFGEAYEPLASELASFGQFVGSWAIRWTRTNDDQATPETHGELHFGWVLGGRAVQDVWIVPGRDTRKAGLGADAFWGTTIRFFDPQLGAWRSTWVEPISGRVRKFIGRRVGDEIHLVSTDGEPFLRWRFTEIDSDRFVWLGEYSADEARTWHLEERMVATRTNVTRPATSRRFSDCLLLSQPPRARFNPAECWRSDLEVRMCTLMPAGSGG